MMMYPEFDRLLSFVSVHHAIQAEKLLVAAGLRVMALPTPRDISISCGQSLLFIAVDEQTIFKVLQQHHVPWSRLFMRSKQPIMYEEIMDYK